MKQALFVLLFVFFLFYPVKIFADNTGSVSTIQKLKESPSSELIIDSIPESRELKDKALSIYVARKLARNYPFSPAASKFLSAVRNGSADDLTAVKGVDFWFIPLSFLRVLILCSALWLVIGFELKSYRTFLFLSLLVLLIVGEGINLSRGLFSSAFIPFEGDRFSFSAPDKTSQAVEKLSSGAEIKISEISGDWIKLELPSGRIGWVENKEGIIESEEQ